MDASNQTSGPIQTAGDEVPTPTEDWFLQYLVQKVNGTDATVPVTLNVGGVLISGNMVSGHKYFEGFGKGIRKMFTALENDIAERLERSFARIGEEVYASDHDEDQSKDTEILPPSFIHLQDARIYTANMVPIPTGKGVWWRGKLSSVEGFVLGILQSTTGRT